MCVADWLGDENNTHCPGLELTEQDNLFHQVDQIVVLHVPLSWR